MTKKLGMIGRIIAKIAFYVKKIRAIYRGKRVAL